MYMAVLIWMHVTIMQMQQLMAAQYRMVALEESRRAATREQARIRHKRFVGDGVAYTRD